MRRTLVLSLLAISAIALLNSGHTAPARAFSGGGCTLTSTAGGFGFSYNGVAVTPSGNIPVGAVGKYHTDPAGNFTGDEINSLAGAAAYQTLTGKITMSTNCSGELVAKVYQSGQLVRTSYIHLQYQDNGNQVLGIFEKLVLPDHTQLPVVIKINGSRISTN